MCLLEICWTLLPWEITCHFHRILRSHGQGATKASTMEKEPVPAVVCLCKPETTQRLQEAEISLTLKAGKRICSNICIYRIHLQLLSNIKHNPFFFFFNTVKHFWWLLCISSKAKQSSALNFIQDRSNYSSLQGVLGNTLERTNLTSKLTRKFW